MSEPLDAELMTVGTDEVVVTFRTDDESSVVTRVGDRQVTTTGSYHSARVDGLEPLTRYDLAVDGAPYTAQLPVAVTTLQRPEGELLSTFATVNDVHFGEVECGHLDVPEGEDFVTVFTAEPGDPPYPEVMNRAAIDEISAIDPDVVIVKGDLTDLGTAEQYEMFLDAYGRLGPRLYHVRGNHDAMIDDSMAIERAPYAIDLKGATLAVLDTTTPGTDKGRLPADQVAWLDQVAAESIDPVLVFGHHHPWDPASAKRSDNYFGINPDDSEAFLDVVARRESIAGYFAGHTHRNRVRRFPAAREVPMVEVACVKDYPGAWAEYRVYDGGYLHLMRRISAPDAMAWTEKTRAMFDGLYRDYALGGIEDRCFAELFRSP